MRTPSATADPADLSAHRTRTNVRPVPPRPGR